MYASSERTQKEAGLCCCWNAVVDINIRTESAIRPRETTGRHLFGNKNRLLSCSYLFHLGQLLLDFMLALNINDCRYALIYVSCAPSCKSNRCHYPCSKENYYNQIRKNLLTLLHIGPTSRVPVEGKSSVCLHDLYEI